MIDKIFVVHYEKLKDRFAYLYPELDKRHHLVEWVTEPSREDLTPLKIQEWCDLTKEGWIEKTEGLYNNETPFREMQIGEIAATIGHFNVWEKILKAEGEIFVVLEDDVIIKDNLWPYIEKWIKDLPEDWNMVFFGINFDERTIFTNPISPQAGKFIYKKEPPQTRCADAYIINKKTAKTLLDNIKRFATPIDLELNYWLKKLNMNIYWFYPGLVVQGTFLPISQGGYKSSFEIKTSNDDLVDLDGYHHKYSWYQNMK